MADMLWRNIRRIVRDVTGSAAAAITNANSAITSRLRRGTGTVPPVTTAPQPIHATEFARLPQQPLVTVSVVNYQPLSIRTIAGERVLGDDRYNASRFKVENKITAMKRDCIVKIITLKTTMNEDTFLTKVKITLCKLLEQHCNTKNRLKLICLMARTDMATSEEHEEKGIFWSDVHDNYPVTDINNMYITMRETVLDEFAKYLNNGSSWRFKEVHCLEVYIDKNVPLRGRSYKVLPKFVLCKKAVISIKNDDNQCFKW
jgi:hypothetical protein